MLSLLTLLPRRFLNIFLLLFEYPELLSKDKESGRGFGNAYEIQALWRTAFFGVSLLRVLFPIILHLPCLRPCYIDRQVQLQEPSHPLCGLLKRIDYCCHNCICRWYKLLFHLDVFQRFPFPNYRSLFIHPDGALDRRPGVLPDLLPCAS